MKVAMRWFTRMTLPLFMLVSMAVAQEGGWRLDKEHSSILFSITHIVVSEIQGRFGDYDITFTSSKEDFTDAVVAANIRVNSIDTESEGRDRDLRSENFFDVQKFPEIKFSGNSFKKVGENKYDVTGDLTIRDVTKQVTFHAEYRGSIKTLARGMVAAWRASLEINRFDYGLKWNPVLETGGLVAGETVTITMSLQFRK